MAAPIAEALRAVAPRREFLPLGVPSAKAARLVRLRGIALAVVLAACGRHPVDDMLARAHARGNLRWGGDVQGGEPYVFQDPRDGDRVVGFEVEIADALARRLGLRAEFVQNDWQTLVPSLDRGDFDIALNGIEVTPARRARVAFTRPYYAFTETIVVRRNDGGAQTLADLRGRRVGTLDGSLALDLLAAEPGVEVVRYEGVEEPYLDLERGRLAAVLLDNVIAARYALPRPMLRAAATVGEGVYAIGVRPDQVALLAALDGALGGMIADGELRRILERWHLWDERQVVLAATVPAATDGGLPARLTLAYLPLFLRGAAYTVVISVLAMALAVAGGLALSLVRRYGGPIPQSAAGLYVELFRGTPVLLQLYVLYYGLAPVLPLDAFTAAVVGLGLNYAAYESELYRAGLDAVPVGQTEAALALGMSRATTLRRIVLPQALRVALPGVANDFIALLKDSSLVSVITVVELTKQMTITAVDVRGWLGPGLLCAALYLALSYPLSRLARRLERELAPAPA
jgi:polar amino acid transport system permease protein/polar amino acid transport system substrate-binding protein